MEIERQLRPLRKEKEPCERITESIARCSVLMISGDALVRSSNRKQSRPLWRFQLSVENERAYLESSVVDKLARANSSIGKPS